MEVNKIYNESCLDTLRRMPDGFLDCVVTSPPYFGLRDYGVDGQIGLEPTPAEYVARLVEVFMEIRRALKPAGTVWLNLGDSYSSIGHKKSHSGFNTSTLAGGEQTHTPLRRENNGSSLGLKHKDLMGMPWRVAFALQDAGFWLRQDIIWAKPNPMPESVTDRCTKAHEYIFLLSKSQKYYFDQDAIREPLKDASVARLIQNVEEQAGSDRVPGKSNGNMKAVRFGGNKYGDSDDPHHNTKSGKVWTPKQAGSGAINQQGRSGYFLPDGSPVCGATANKKSVWTVTTKPFKAAHFATFPPELIRPCILAGCPPDGIVYDPFMGAGTTALVAHQYGRQWIGSELNPEYVEIANKRLEPYLAQVSLFR